MTKRIHKVHGESVRALCARYQFRARDLADLVGVSRNAVLAWQRAEHSGVSRATSEWVGLLWEVESYVRDSQESDFLALCERMREAFDRGRVMLARHLLLHAAAPLLFMGRIHR